MSAPKNFSDLSREEKDALAMKRMMEMKAINEKLMQRHAEVEKDRLTAEKKNSAVKTTTKMGSKKEVSADAKEEMESKIEYEREWDRGKDEEELWKDPVMYDSNKKGRQDWRTEKSDWKASAGLKYQRKYENDVGNSYSDMRSGRGNYNVRHGFESQCTNRNDYGNFRGSRSRAKYGQRSPYLGMVNKYGPRSSHSNDDYEQKKANHSKSIDKKHENAPSSDSSYSDPELRTLAKAPAVSALWSDDEMAEVQHKHRRVKNWINSINQSDSWEDANAPKSYSNDRERTNRVPYNQQRKFNNLQTGEHDDINAKSQSISFGKKQMHFTDNDRKYDNAPFSRGTHNRGHEKHSYDSSAFKRHDNYSKASSDKSRRNVAYNSNSQQHNAHGQTDDKRSKRNSGFRLNKFEQNQHFKGAEVRYNERKVVENIQKQSHAYDDSRGDIDKSNNFEAVVSPGKTLKEIDSWADINQSHIFKDLASGEKVRKNDGWDDIDQSHTFKDNASPKKILKEADDGWGNIDQSDIFKDNAHPQKYLKEADDGWGNIDQSDIFKDNASPKKSLKEADDGWGNIDQSDIFKDSASPEKLLKEADDGWGDIDQSDIFKDIVSPEKSLKEADDGWGEIDQSDIFKDIVSPEKSLKEVDDGWGEIDQSDIFKDIASPEKSLKEADDGWGDIDQSDIFKDIATPEKSLGDAIVCDRWSDNNQPCISKDSVSQGDESHVFTKNEFENLNESEGLNVNESDPSNHDRGNSVIGFVSGSKNVFDKEIKHSSCHELKGRDYSYLSNRVSDLNSDISSPKNVSDENIECKHYENCDKNIHTHSDIVNVLQNSKSQESDLIPYESDTDHPKSISVSEMAPVCDTKSLNLSTLLPVENSPPKELVRGAVSKSVEMFQEIKIVEDAKFDEKSITKDLIALSTETEKNNSEFYEHSGETSAIKTCQSISANCTESAEFVRIFNAGFSVQDKTSGDSQGDSQSDVPSSQNDLAAHIDLSINNNPVQTFERDGQIPLKSSRLPEFDSENPCDLSGSDDGGWSTVSDEADSNVESTDEIINN